MLKKILLCSLLISTSAYADGGFGGSFAGGLTGSMVGGLVTGAATQGGRSSDSRKSKENYRSIKELRNNVTKDLRAMARRMDAMEEHFERKIKDLHEEIKDLKKR
ncbi:hypothetical protein JKY79_03785 [Candidatus Babeliales bacterium]|nr:hypothetical protein [Candidatus Babeliales bacterium]